MTTVTWLFIINLFSTIVSSTVLYVKSYSKEKGKNLATKEDIEEITQKVETVKSEIGLLAQKQTNYYTERYSSLIDCHGKYNMWINVILNTHITGEFIKSDEFRDQAEQKLETSFLEFLAAEAKFAIYFVDSDLLVAERELKMKTIDLSNYLKIWLVNGQTISRQLAIADTLDDYEMRATELEKLFQQRHKIIVDFYEERNAKYSPIALLGGTFTRMIHSEVAAM
jgi:hypothetical protein